MELYRPRHLWQGDPHDDDPHGWYDCGSFSMAMLIDAITHGHIVPSGHDIRDLTNEPKPDANDPGVNHDQLAHAVGRFGARVLDRVKPWRQYEAEVAALRGTCLSVWYPELGAYRSQTVGDDFGHDMFVMARSSDGKKMLVFDPLAHAGRWVPIVTLRKAAEAWGKRTGVSGSVRYITSMDAIPYA